MPVLLMIATALAVVALVVVLAVYLIRITALLERIGGSPTSLLAKLRLGLRAIETETGHLPRLVPRLNETLSDVAGGLGEVENDLSGTVDAAINQKHYR